MSISSFLFLLGVTSGVAGFGGFGKPSPLYSHQDVGITQVNVTTFKSIVPGSSTAWLVEFYSSYCGHCVHFAPTFKELARHANRKVFSFPFTI